MATVTTRLTKLNPTYTGIFLICLVSFIWALMEMITAVVAVDYSLYQVVWVRYAVHLLFMLLVFAPRRGLRLVATRRPGLQILRALMMLIMPVSFILAAPWMPVGNILGIFWLAPLMIVLLSIGLLNERPSWHTWALIAAGLVVVLALLRPGGAFTLQGVLLSLAMGLSFSLYLVMTRILRHESTLTSLFYTAAGVLIPLSLQMPAVWRPLDLTSALLMALIGLLGFGLLWLLDKTFEISSAAVVAPFLYSQMFWMLVLRIAARMV